MKSFVAGLVFALLILLVPSPAVVASDAVAESSATALKADPPSGKESAGDAQAKTRNKKKDRPAKQPATDTAAKKTDAAPEKKPEAKPADKSSAAGAPAKDASAAKSAASTAATKPAEKPAEKPAAPATYTVKKRPLKVELALEGIFEAEQLSDIALHTDEWSDFEVQRAVPHGARVKRGELLVSLDTEKIDRVIADLQRDQAVARLAQREAELQLETLAVSAPIDLAMSERSKRNAGQDQKYYFDIEKGLSQRMADFMLKMAENQLAYETEELKQLEKMYKADDIVEDTEEIILKRARDAVDRAKFIVDRYKIERDNVLKTTLPRFEETLKFGVELKDLEFRKLKETQPLARQKLEAALQKIKIEAERSEKKLKRLLADREALNVKSPTAGIVYYGRCVRGRWVATETISEKLRRGGRLMGDEVFMTVVSPRPLSIRTSVSEKQLQNAAVGIKGWATPTGYTNLKLPVVLQRVSPVPFGSRDFDASLTVALEDGADALMPGMTCDVKLVAYKKADALAVPAAAVETDEDNPTQQYVHLLDKDRKAQRHAVTVGRQTEKLIEIVKGLKEGDEILEEAPKDPSKESAKTKPAEPKTTPAAKRS